MNMYAVSVKNPVVVTYEVENGIIQQALFLTGTNSDKLQQDKKTLGMFKLFHIIDLWSSLLTIIVLV